MQDAQVIARIQTKYKSLEPEMDERMQRQWAASEAREVGWGGITAVAQATGISRTTITAGLRGIDAAGRRTYAGGGSYPTSRRVAVSL